MTSAGRLFLMLGGAIAFSMFSIFAKADDVEDSSDRNSNNSSDNNTVIILGRKSETTRSRKTGQSVVITPSDESRFDTLSHLKQESSIVSPETSRISASGFVVPKIRGQDVKATDVYVEDILLQDPYSGLPLVEDLDLRAFGQMEIHQGVPPVDIPGFNPIGAIRYRFKTNDKPGKKISFSAGTQYGEPFGTSVWSSDDYSSDDHQVFAKVYGRQHQTNGRYLYYSDEGTPYNTTDDYYRVRDNNDERSIQAMPYLKLQDDENKFESIGWIYQSKRGIPATSMVIPSNAREVSDGGLLTAKYSRFINLASNVTLIPGLAIGHTEDDRQIDDPSQQFLLAASSSQFKVKSNRGSIFAIIKNQSMSFNIKNDQNHAIVTNQLDHADVLKLRRSESIWDSGFKWSPMPFMTTELKGSVRTINDDHHDTPNQIWLPEENPDHHRQRNSESYGGSWAIYPGIFSLYTQYGLARRIPSLVEEFGNGGTIRPNDEIKPEFTIHKEIGVTIDSIFSYLTWGLAAYDDRTTDKISLVPSTANSMKASNIRSTEIRGVDTRLEYQYVETSALVGLSRIFPFDESQDDRKILPSTPETVVIISLEQKVGPITARWLARYRDQIYRDLGNTMVVPSVWINDVSLDYSKHFYGNSLSAGLAVKNVLNVMSLPISAPESPSNVGRTAYSDYDGAPLPGRSWILSVSIKV